MRILCTGWKRWVKTHSLLPQDADLTKVEEKSEDELWWLGKDIQVTMERDEVLIRSSAQGLKLGGNYWVDIHLSKREIAMLAGLALSKQSFGRVVESLSKSRHQYRAKRRTEAKR